MTENVSTRITLLHATPVAMGPINAAMAVLWPEADVTNLLDDGLSIDRAREEGPLSSELINRFIELGRYARSAGANGILATCSSFGTALDEMAAAIDIPVVKPNEAMFREAITYGKRIGMLANFAPAVAPMTEEFYAFAQEEGVTASLETIIVEGANDRLKAGDVAGHNSLVAARASHFADFDAIMLAHFSNSQAADDVRKMVNIPVLTAPAAAIAEMRRLVETG